MEYQPFTAGNAALLLIDYQTGTMQLIRNRSRDQVHRNGVLLARLAAALHLPAVLTSSLEDQFQGPLLPELAEVLPAEYARRSQRLGVVDALDDPGFAAAVEATGRRNLIIAGVTTDVCLIHPAVRAVAGGYQVQVVVDASGSNTAVSDQIALQTMQHAGVRLTTMPQLMSELAGDWTSPTGTAVMDLLNRGWQPLVADESFAYQ
jgi:nicotinamidase-related amidase